MAERNSSAADLSVTKTASPDRIIAGQRVVFFITVTNLGPGRAENVIIRDAVSPYLMETEYSMDSGKTWIPWEGSYTAAFLEAAKSVEILLRGRTEPSFTGILCSTASVSSDTPDPDWSNNADEAEVTAEVRADLSVRKKAEPNPLRPGGPVAYEIKVRNWGPSDAVQVTLEDTIPSVLENLEVSGDDGESWEPWDGLWTTEFLAAGTFVRLLLRGVLPHNAEGQLISSVEVSSSTRDPYPENNKCMLVTPIVPRPELFITQAVYPDCAIPCEYLIYTILVENCGFADAADVVLTDYIPRELWNLQFSVNGGRTWSKWRGAETVGTIGKGEIVTILIAGIVHAKSCGVIVNTASVSGAGTAMAGTIHAVTDNGVTAGGGMSHAVTVREETGECVLNDSVTITTPVKPCPCCETEKSLHLKKSKVYKDFFYGVL